MYDINYTNLKKSKKFYRVFLYAGLIIFLILFGIVFGSRIKLKTLDSYRVTRHIEVLEHEDDDGDTMYTPVYYYSVNGKEYTCKSGFSSNHRPNTSSGKVYYDSKNPERCMTDYSLKGNKTIIIFSILPIIFIIIGSISISK